MAPADVPSDKSRATASREARLREELRVSRTLYDVVKDECAATRANIEELKYDADRRMYQATVHCNHLGTIIPELRQEDEGATCRMEELERRLGLAQEISHTSRAWQLGVFRSNADGIYNVRH